MCGFNVPVLSKPYMPCFPGLHPVIIDVHAGALKGGVVDLSLPYVPFSFNFFKLGSLSVLIHHSSQALYP